MSTSIEGRFWHARLVMLRNGGIVHQLRGRQSNGELRDPSMWHWAIGKVQYHLVDLHAEDGILVYLKASLTGDKPTDVLRYHREHLDFSRQTTADQWFTKDSRPATYLGVLKRSGRSGSHGHQMFRLSCDRQVPFGACDLGFVNCR
ncbi:MAG: hypothetical protein DMG49_15320 [Acidobacteria bacterium]|nr:MAG: hypothetical protein DMG49_15320 [Acidobacteriota bacterium]